LCRKDNLYGMPEKLKPTRLSSRLLGPFKGVLYALYSSFFILIIILIFQRERWYLGLLQSGIYFYGLFILVKMTRKLQHVSFDDGFLYVHSVNPEIVIPLENIESVEIETLGGTYKVNLYTAEQLGKEFYFKTSLIYPLNYKSKDALVNVLRRDIIKAKSRRQSLPHNALMS